MEKSAPISSAPREAIVIVIDFFAGTLVTFVSHPSLIHWWQETKVCFRVRSLKLITDCPWKWMEEDQIYNDFPLFHGAFFGEGTGPSFSGRFFCSVSAWRFYVMSPKMKLKLVLHLLRGGDHVFFCLKYFPCIPPPNKKNVIETCQQQVGMPSPGLQPFVTWLKTQPSRCTLNKSFRPYVETWSRWLCAYVTLAAVKSLGFWGVSSASKTEDRQARWHVWGNKTCFFLGKMDGFGWFMSMVLRQLLCMYI